MIDLLLRNLVTIRKWPWVTDGMYRKLIVGSVGFHLTGSCPALGRPNCGIGVKTLHFIIIIIIIKTLIRRTAHLMTRGTNDVGVAPVAAVMLVVDIAPVVPVALVIKMAPVVTRRRAPVATVALSNEILCSHNCRRSCVKLTV